MIDIKVCYFASLSEVLGLKEETLEIATPITIDALRKMLIARGGKWQALNDTQLLQACNHEMVKADTLLAKGDEIAFFPPVTGG